MRSKMWETSTETIVQVFVVSRCFHHTFTKGPSDANAPPVRRCLLVL